MFKFEKIKFNAAKLHKVFFRKNKSAKTNILNEFC